MLAFELTQVEIRTAYDQATLQFDMMIIERKLKALYEQVGYMLIHQAPEIEQHLRIIEEWQFTFEETIVIHENLYGAPHE